MRVCKSCNSLISAVMMNARKTAAVRFFSDSQFGVTFQRTECTHKRARSPLRWVTRYFPCKPTDTLDALPTAVMVTGGMRQLGPLLSGVLDGPTVNNLPAPSTEAFCPLRVDHFPAKIAGVAVMVTRFALAKPQPGHFFSIEAQDDNNHGCFC